MKIGIVQMDVVWQDPEANAARLLELVSAAEPAQMLILPELMSIFARKTREPSGNSPFFMRRKRSRFSSTERSR